MLRERNSNSRKGSQAAEDFLIDVAQLMAGGYSMSDSVVILSQESRYGSVPALLKDSLAEGLAFSEALERIPTIIDPVISMYIRSAEETGNLTHAMQEVSTRILARRKWDQMVSEILFYPRLVLISVMLILDAFWLFFLPFIESFLYSMGMEAVFWTGLVSLSKSFLWTLPFINIASAWVAFSDA
jgi:type II secretory pathway component PulF